jgi:leucyl-tRNA synthetase
VALCDQWYLAYDDAAWKDKVRNHLKTNFTAYSNETHKALLDTVDWLREWGCSRSFGLGTRLPWDKQFLIESLSDSTLYFAFYTIVHYLQSNFDGSQRGTLDIDPNHFNNETWDYIFLNKPYDATKI